ncbi:MAG: alpha/beta hydrolase [Eggerthellaceae bacterium]|jgi:acetyl esterase
MKIVAYPGYESQVYAYLGDANGEKASMEDIQKSILEYEVGEGTTLEDRMIPGPKNGSDLQIRIIKPAGLPEKAPIVIDFHGGGFVSGNNDIDNYRNITFAETTPCIVVSVEYRLSNEEVHFPAPLEDAIAAYTWVHEHAVEFGGDSERLAINGTSAGATIVGGLQLYLRDTNYPVQPKLTIMNCPVIKRGPSGSKTQLGIMGDPDAPFTTDVEYIYLPPDGTTPSYYAFPGYCPDLSKLGPTMVIVAEYDPLRDEGLEYGSRLLKAGVPCEMLVAPRVTHGFCTMNRPLTHWVHAGICASLRREFGMEITEF